jgi:23S rRNA pseudouridine1911/1915/1917 synthase
VHRLDEVASGLLVFAKHEAVQRALHDIFARHDVERVYLAVVHGQPRTDSGVVRTRLIESDRRPFKVRSPRAADPPALGRRAERACTHWRVIGRDAGRAALLVRLETGKKRRIRVHLAERAGTRSWATGSMAAPHSRGSSSMPRSCGSATP